MQDDIVIISVSAYTANISKRYLQMYLLYVKGLNDTGRGTTIS